MNVDLDKLKNTLHISTEILMRFFNYPEWSFIRSSDRKVIMLVLLGFLTFISTKKFHFQFSWWQCFLTPKLGICAWVSNVMTLGTFRLFCLEPKDKLFILKNLIKQLTTLDRLMCEHIHKQNRLRLFLMKCMTWELNKLRGTIQLLRI